VKLIKVGLRLRFFRVLVVYDLGEIAADHEQRRERLARCAEDTLAVVDCLLKVAVALGVGLGLREGEAFGLTVPRVDFLRRKIQVPS
jgi:hypothetical protein